MTSLEESSSVTRRPLQQKQPVPQDTEQRRHTVYDKGTTHSQQQPLVSVLMHHDSEASYRGAAGSLAVRSSRTGEGTSSPRRQCPHSVPEQKKKKKRSWLRTLPYYIARRLARQDFVAVSNALQLVPLKFRSSSDEREFVAHILPAYGVRIRLSACIGGIVLASFWIVCGVTIGTGIYPIGKSFWSSVSLHATFFLVTVILTVYYLSTWCRYLQSRFEFVVLGVVIAVVLMPLIWNLLATILLYTKVESPERYVFTHVGIDMDQLKLWTIPFVIGIPLWNLVLLNLFMQTRTRISFFPQIAVLGCLLILNVAQSSIAAKIQRLDSAQSGYYAGSLLIIVAGLECWSLLCVFLMCYFGRWNLELQERIEFWKFTKSKEHLRELHESQARRKRKTGSTAVEDLLHILVRAMTNVQEAEVTTGNKLLVESTELLRQIQDVLTNTENLYAVRIVQDQASADDTGGTQQTVESAQLEAKFYEIYGNRKVTQASEAQHLKQLLLDASGEAQEGQVSDETKQQRSVVGLKIRNLAPPPKASAAFRRGVGREWNCNMLKAAEEYPNILVEVGALLLEPKSLHLATSPVRIRNYVYRLERLYRVNPYHNSTHGAMVAHSMCCFLRMLEISDAPCFPTLGFVMVVISALGHDAGHPGRNNQFYVNAFQNMALLYNDKSVLENYHSALVFKSLEPKSCDIFEALNSDTVRELRKKIIDLILATDMGLHFESVSKFRLRRQSAGFNFLTDVDDMWLVIRMCIKCADLSHALVDWNQHQAWSIRVVEEFYQQGEEEAQLGLPKSPLCERSQHNELAKSQKGFIEFVVQPLMSQMDELDLKERIADNCLRHLTYNKYKWEEYCRDRRTVEIPMKIQNIRTDSASCRLLLFHLFVPKGCKLVPNASDESPETLFEGRPICESKSLDYFSSHALGGEEDHDDGLQADDALDLEDELADEGYSKTVEAYEPLVTISSGGGSLEYSDLEGSFSDISGAEYSAGFSANENSRLSDTDALSSHTKPKTDVWRGKRTSTLETARFGGESGVDFDEYDADVLSDDNYHNGTADFDDADGGCIGAISDTTFWDEEEDDAERNVAERMDIAVHRNHRPENDDTTHKHLDDEQVSHHSNLCDVLEQVEEEHEDEEKLHRGPEASSTSRTSSSFRRSHEESSVGTTDTASYNGPDQYSSPSSGQTVEGLGGSQPPVYAQRSLLRAMLANPALFYYIIESYVRPET